MVTGNLAEAIRRRLATAPRIPHDAVVVGAKIAEFRAIVGVDDPVSRAFVRDYLAYLEENGFVDLIDLQMRYAKRIADSPGPIQYEEMHKLFSLCEDVEALRGLGLPFSEPLLRAFSESIATRFRAEPEKARLVAEDCRSENSDTQWWYQLANK